MAAEKSAVAAAKNSGCGLVFMAVWLGLWSLFTLAADSFLAYSAFRQCKAYTYGSTQGTVTATNIESHDDSENGTTYTPVVKYAYAVDGRQLQGETISYLFVSSSHQAALKVIERFPAGQPVTIYYNSASPSDCVLVRGIDGMGLFMGIFLLPFNAIMVGVWYAFFSHVGPGRRLRRWLHFRARDDGLRARLTIYTLPPLLALGLGAGAAAFAMVFVVGFGMSALPVFWLAIAGWIVVLAAGIFAWRFAFRWVKVLEFDRLGGKLQIQPSDSPRTFTAADVREIVVESFSTKDDDGNVKSRFSTCLVCQGDGADERIELCTWSAEDLAQSVRAWVSEKLRKE